MARSSVITTEYRTGDANNTSFAASLSDRDDIATSDDYGQSVRGDFVPAPSCWFESSPASSKSNDNHKHITADDVGAIPECHVDDIEQETTSDDTETNKLTPASTGIATFNSSERTRDLHSRNHDYEKEQTERREEQADFTPCSSQFHSRREVALSGSTKLGAKALPIYHCENVVVGHTRPSPSWREISSQVLPAAAQELLSSSIRRLYYTAKISYSRGRWHRKYSDMGQNAGGFSIASSTNCDLPRHLSELPPFSGLSWIDRQLVREWRTYLPQTPPDAIESEDFEFEQARTLVPSPIPRPRWQNADVCHQCHKPFGPIRLRHHCRSCGRSFCHDHSASTHRLTHLGYDDVPERVCDACKWVLEDQNLAERIAWRLARCRDYSQGNLTPYFETGLDSVEDVALRVTKAAIAMAKSIPLGAQATVAVETVNVLRKYGLHGIYGIMLRQEFLAAADLLRKALGINKSSWPLSVHELSAAIFYALAQHRAMRGLYPERENTMHRFRSIDEETQQHPPVSNPAIENASSSSNEEGRGEGKTSGTRTDRYFSRCDRNEIGITHPDDRYGSSASDFLNNAMVDEVKFCQNEPSRKPCQPLYASKAPKRSGNEGEQDDQSTPSLRTFSPVCDPVPDSVLGPLLFYAPIALNFIYATKEVEMQLLAAQQGWRLLYAFLHQDTNSTKPSDRPASAIFLHQERKVICLSIRGTATIHDVITDIRQTPVPFPNSNVGEECSQNNDCDWTTIDCGQGLALCGMASAATNLFQEHFDSILYFVKKGYRVRLVGHSLGGGVATMIGVLVLKHLEQLGYSNHSDPSTPENKLLQVYAYGTPSCFDAKLADSVDSFVTTVVLHDDVFPRLTPSSCRGLLKHLLYIRETWVKAHIEEDLRAVGERAKTAWAPRFRQNFALRSSTSSIKKYCRKQIVRGKNKLTSTKSYKTNKSSVETLDACTQDVANHDSKHEHYDCSEIESITSDRSEWGEKFFVATTNLSSTIRSQEKMNEAKDANAHVSDDDPQTQLLLEFLGGGDNKRQGIIIDGDEFFETERDEECDSHDTLASIDDECYSDPIGELFDETSIQMGDSWSLDMQKGESSPSLKQNVKNDHTPIILDETPLLHMFVPGKVVHIYSHRGVYKTAYVPRTFPELRKISLAGNMLSDHTTKSYFESLQEVQTSRNASESPPKWTAYDEDDTCCCCANRFTWASTSNSEAQEARDKHNCRSCGGLICDPCSKNRVPIPSIGLTVPVRVCDRCYNDIVGVASGTSSDISSCDLTSKVDDYKTNNNSFPGAFEDAEKPQRSRQKRSAVVDDLVSKMRSSDLT